VGACSADATDSGSTSETTTPPTVELAERWDPAMAATSDGIFVWGGSAGDRETPPLGEFAPSYLDDGAIIEGAGATGRAVAPSPFEAPLRGVSARTVGDEVLVVGTTCAEAADVDSDQPICRPDAELAVAVYDPATDEWRSVELPPELRGPGSWIWTTGATADGRVVVHVTKGEAPEVWLLDLADGRWTVLEGDSAWSSGECVAGDHLLRIVSTTALASFDLTSAQPTAEPSADLPQELAFDPWSTMLTCTDDAAFVMEWGADTPARRFDPATGTWSFTSAPPRPSPDPRAFTQLTKHSWNGEELLYLSVLDQQPGLAYRPATGEWRVTKPPIPVGVERVPDEPLWTSEGVANWTPDGIELLDVDPD
jgi:hypothetical protein